jgi:hypothetical protein
MHDMALALNSRDFSSFYQNIAKLWQAQTSAEDLASAFASLMDQDVDLKVLEGMDPIFSEVPHIDAETGMLTVQGYYETQPSVTHIDLGYLYEHPVWKLGSVDLQFR